MNNSSTLIPFPASAVLAAVSLSAALILFPSALRAQTAAQPVTPADTIHPNIHQNNGTNAGACPGDQDHCNNRHGIANNPGQSGANPADGRPGFADQLETVHGGIGAVNRNATGGEASGGGGAVAAAVGGGATLERGAAAKRSSRGNGNGGAQVKGALCHIGEEPVVDENGDPIVDPETGVALTLQTSTVIVIPAHAAQKHIARHGDFVIPYVTDEETGETALSAEALADCAALDEGVDD